MCAGIQQKIEKALQERKGELEALSQGVVGDQDGWDVLLTIVDQSKSLMQEIILNGNYDKVLDRKDLHYPARLDEMFQSFSDNLHGVVERILNQTKTQEILSRMTEMKGVTLPNFLSPTLMKILVREEIDKFTKDCTDLVPRTHDFAQKFVFNIIDQSTSAFPNLQVAFKQVSPSIDRLYVIALLCCRTSAHRT